MTLAPETVRRIRETASRYPSPQSAIIPALWAVQHENGYVTPEALLEIAQHLSLPPSLVEATSSFYSMFLTRPEGRHDVVICVNAPCALRGADEAMAYAQRKLGVRDGETTPDGVITLRSTIECLGACGGAPMMQVDHRFEENLTPEKMDAIFTRLRTSPAPHEERLSHAAAAPTAPPPAPPKAIEPPASAPPTEVKKTEEPPKAAPAPVAREAPQAVPPRPSVPEQPPAAPAPKAEEEAPAQAPDATGAPKRPRRPRVAGEKTRSGATGARPRGKKGQP